MSETKLIDIKELKFDEHNFNRHNDEGMSLLEKSIKENGLGRSILLDKDNNIVGGNGVTEKAIELGKTKVRIIETDGSELIAVKRTDLTLDSEQGRKMALADNSVAHANLEWNEDELQKAQDEWGLVPEEWGVELPDFGLSDDYGDEIGWKGGDKSPFTQITFVVANEQADFINRMLSEAKKQDGYGEEYGNTNSNGNAIYLIVKQWAEQKKLS